MTQDTTYEGWSNYPTWAVNLWLSNDEGLYDAALELVKDCRETAHLHPSYTDGIWDLGEARRFTTVDALKSWVEELVETEEANLRSDLIGYALGEVNWDEIAAEWMGAYAELISAEVDS